MHIELFCAGKEAGVGADVKVVVVGKGGGGNGTADCESAKGGWGGESMY